MDPVFSVLYSQNLFNFVAKQMPPKSLGKVSLCNKILYNEVKKFFDANWIHLIQKSYGTDTRLHMYNWLKFKNNPEVNKITFLSLIILDTIDIENRSRINTPIGFHFTELDNVDQYTMSIAISELIQRVSDEEKQYLYETYSARLLSDFPDNAFIASEFAPLFGDFLKRGLLDEILNHVESHNILENILCTIYYSNDPDADSVIDKLIFDGHPKLDSEHISNLICYTSKPESLEALVQSPFFQPNLPAGTHKNTLWQCPKKNISYVKVLLKAGVSPIDENPILNVIGWCETCDELLDMIKLFHETNPRSLENSQDIIITILSIEDFDASPAILLLRNLGMPFEKHLNGEEWIRFAIDKYKAFPNVVKLLLNDDDRTWQPTRPYPDVTQELLFYYYCCMGFIEKIKKWPIEKIPVDLRFHLSNTPLRVAIKGGHLDIAQYLLRHLKNPWLGLEIDYNETSFTSALKIENPTIRSEIALLIARPEIFSSDVNQRAVLNLINTDLPLFEKLFEIMKDQCNFSHRFGSDIAHNFSKYLKNGDLDTFQLSEKYIKFNYNFLYKCFLLENVEPIIEKLLTRYPSWMAPEMLFLPEKSYYKPIFKLTKKLRTSFYDKLLTKENLCMPNDILKDIYQIPFFLTKEHWLEIKQRLALVKINFSDRNQRDTAPFLYLFGNFQADSNIAEAEIEYVTNNFEECLWVMCDMITFAWERGAESALYTLSYHKGRTNVETPLHILVGSGASLTPIFLKLMIGLIKHLGQIGYPLNLLTDKSGSALNLAYRFKYLELAKALLEAGATKKMTPQEIKQDIDIAIQYGGVQFILGMKYNIWTFDP